MYATISKQKKESQFSYLFIHIIRLFPLQNALSIQITCILSFFLFYFGFVFLFSSISFGWHCNALNAFIPYHELYIVHTQKKKKKKKKCTQLIPWCNHSRMFVYFPFLFFRFMEKNSYAHIIFALTSIHFQWWNSISLYIIYDFIDVLF